MNSDYHERGKPVNSSKSFKQMQNKICLVVTPADISNNGKWNICVRKKNGAFIALSQQRIIKSRNRFPFDEINHRNNQWSTTNDKRQLNRFRANINRCTFWNLIEDILFVEVERNSQTINSNTMQSTIFNFAMGTKDNLKSWKKFGWKSVFFCFSFFFLYQFATNCFDAKH